MRRYLSLIALILIFPSLVFAQGTMSVKDLDTKLTTYYYTKTATDALLNDKASTASVTLKANSADVNTTAEITALLADKADTASVAVKADKSYVDTTDEVLTAAVATKANSADVNTTAEITALLADKADTASVAVKADKTYVDETIEAKAAAIEPLIANNTVSSFAVDEGVTFTGEVRLKAGSDINLTQSGNTVEVSQYNHTNTTVGLYTTSKLWGAVKTSEEVAVLEYNKINPHGLDMYFDTAQVSLSTGAVALLSVCKLNTTEVVAAFCDSETSGSGNLFVVRGYVANQSDYKITWGNPVMLNEAYSPTYIKIIRMADTKFAVMFKPSSESHRVVGGTVINGNITLGVSASSGVESAPTSYRITICNFNETTACIYYNTGAMRALNGKPVFIDSSNVVTFGTTVAPSMNYAFTILAYPLNSTQNIVIASNLQSGKKLVGKIANINAGVLTWTGTTSELNDVDAAYGASHMPIINCPSIEKLTNIANTFAICYYDNNSNGFPHIITAKIDDSGNVVRTSTNNYCSTYNSTITSGGYDETTMSALSNGSTILTIRSIRCSEHLNYVLNFDLYGRPSISATEILKYTNGDPAYRVSFMSSLAFNDRVFVVSNKINGIYGSQYVLDLHKYKYTVEPVLGVSVVYPYSIKYIKPYSVISDTSWTLTPNTRVFTSPSVYYPITLDSVYYDKDLSISIGVAKSTTEIYIDATCGLFNKSIKEKNRMIAVYGTTNDWYVPFIIDDVYKYPVYFNGLLQAPEDYTITTYAVPAGQYNTTNSIGYTRIQTITPENAYGNKVIVMKSE